MDLRDERASPNFRDDTSKLLTLLFRNHSNAKNVPGMLATQRGAIDQFLQSSDGYRQTFGSPSFDTPYIRQFYDDGPSSVLLEIMRNAGGGSLRKR